MEEVMRKLWPNMLVIIIILMLVLGQSYSTQAQQGEGYSLLPKSDETPKILEALFLALLVAPDNESAKYFEERILKVWSVSKSDTANLLFARASEAQSKNRPDIAIALLTEIIEIAPDFVEARNRRGNLYFLQRDFSAAVIDIAFVLAHEPRHFQAMTGLGVILQETGDDSKALMVLRRVINIHPHMEKVPDLVKNLSNKVEGRPI